MGYNLRLLVDDAYRFDQIAAICSLQYLPGIGSMRSDILGHVGNRKDAEAQC